MTSTTAPDKLQGLSRPTETPGPAPAPDAFQSGPPASEPDDSAARQPAPDDVDTATAPLE